MRILILVIGVALTSCVSDVSHVVPHRLLTGSLWRLKTDAYLIEFQDSRGNYHVIPSLPEYGYVYLPDGKYEYLEKNIGRKYDGGSMKVVGGLREGDVVRVVRVFEKRNPEVGTKYLPMVVPVNGNRWTGEHELIAWDYYRGFENKGVLNPKYVYKKKLE